MIIISTILAISLCIQLASFIVAADVLRKSTNSIVWWLVSLSLLILTFERVIHLFIFNSLDIKPSGYFLLALVGLVVSVVLLLGVFFLKKIFGNQNNIEKLRSQNESEVISAIVKTEETERQRFAKELHDGLGPLISSVKMSVSSIKRMAANESNRAIIENTEKLIDESIITLKEISNNLSPHVLNNLGLYKALQSFTAKVQNSNNISIMMSSNIEGRRYSYNVEVVFYRIICELITNTLKHASARKINVDLFEDKGELMLEYSDNGIGFKVNDEEQSIHGMGLSNMKSRVKSLNGSYEFTSSSGKGVNCFIKVKLSE